MALAVHDTKLPRYLQVYNILKDWILKGRYAPNEKLPSEGELCEILGVSRITTRRAIEMLSNEGLIRRVQGLGTFVPPSIPKVSEPFGKISDLAERVNRLSERTKLENIEISEVEPDPMAAIELKLSPGQRVIKATYTRTEKSLPIGCADVFIPTDLGVQITAADLENNSSPTLIQDKGFQISGAHQLIGATLSDTETSTRLKMNVGSPLIRIRLLILDQNERPIEYLLAHYRADTYEHHAFLSSL